MRYADLKRERDDAIARAVEAERLSLKSEVDRLQVTHEAALAEARRERNAFRYQLEFQTHSVQLWVTELSALARRGP